MEVIKTNPKPVRIFFFWRPPAEIDTGLLAAWLRGLGRVGNSGQSGVPHLHFSIFVSRVKELPITRDLDHQADNLFASIPVYWEDFRLVRVGRIKCNVHVIRGRPQENWIMEFNELKEERARQAR